MIRKGTRTCYENQKLFFAALSLLFILFAAYVYFVSAAVAHVVVRKELSREIMDAEIKISALEADYIIAKNAVEEEAAYVRGFQKVEEKVFVTRKPSALVLSRNEER